MSTKKTTVTYNGTAGDAFVYGDGELVVHATTNKNGSRSFIYALNGESPEMGTLVKIDLQVITGSCAVTIPGKPKKTLKPGGKISIPAGALYTLSGTGCVLSGTTKPGPGFDGPPPPPPGGGLGGGGGTGPH